MNLNKLAFFSSAEMTVGGGDYDLLFFDRDCLPFAAEGGRFREPGTGKGVGSSTETEGMLSKLSFMESIYKFVV